MRIVCIADTHDRHHLLEVPDGDVLVHAGDGTLRGTREEMEAFARWLLDLPHPRKVLIAGNHDWLFEREAGEARRLVKGVCYLQDEGTTIGGVRFWGSPWQPWFMNWAFNLRRGAPLRARWDLIPADTDVLVTHGPPHGILDAVSGLVARSVGVALGVGEHVGCEDLRTVVARVRPRLHVFGHIHEGYGREEHDGTVFVNASNCDRGYRLVNPPIVVDLETGAVTGCGRGAGRA
jgi:Icc-related predicted phosphoesterase